MHICVLTDPKHVLHPFKCCTNQTSQIPSHNICLCYCHILKRHFKRFIFAFYCVYLYMCVYLHMHASVPKDLHIPGCCSSRVLLAAKDEFWESNSFLHSFRISKCSETLSHLSNTIF